MNRRRLFGAAIVASGLVIAIVSSPGCGDSATSFPAESLGRASQGLWYLDAGLSDAWTDAQLANWENALEEGGATLSACAGFLSSPMAQANPAFGQQLRAACDAYALLNATYMASVTDASDAQAVAVAQEEQLFTYMAFEYMVIAAQAQLAGDGSIPSQTPMPFAPPGNFSTFSDAGASVGWDVWAPPTYEDGGDLAPDADLRVLGSDW